MMDVRWICRQKGHTMGDITAKVLSDYNMPSWTVFSVKLLLDLGGNVFLDVVFLQRRRCDIDAILLHLLAHINVFDDCFWCYASQICIF